MPLFPVENEGLNNNRYGQEKEKASRGLLLRGIDVTSPSGPICEASTSACQTLKMKDIPVYEWNLMCGFGNDSMNATDIK